MALCLWRTKSSHCLFWARWIKESAYGVVVMWLSYWLATLYVYYPWCQWSPHHNETSAKRLNLTILCCFLTEAHMEIEMVIFTTYKNNWWGFMIVNRWFYDDWCWLLMLSDGCWLLDHYCGITENQGWFALTHHFKLMVFNHESLKTTISKGHFIRNHWKSLVKFTENIYFPVEDTCLPVEDTYLQGEAQQKRSRLLTFQRPGEQYRGCCIGLRGLVLLGLQVLGLSMVVTPVRSQRWFLNYGPMVNKLFKYGLISKFTGLSEIYTHRSSELPHLLNPIG